MNSRALLLALSSVALSSCGGAAEPTTDQEEPTQALTATAPAADEALAAAPEPAPAEAAAMPPAEPAAATDAFADENFVPTPRGSATYRQERVFVEPMMMIEGVPTFDQGMGLKASQTPLDLYTFNYYRLDDDSLAFSAETTVLRDDPSQFIFSGTAIWYDRDLNATARGTYKGSQLQGEHQTLDENGKVIKTTLYDKGVPYDPKRFESVVFRPILGTWHADADKGSSISRLVNVYTEDGQVELQNIQLNKNSVLGGDDGLMEWSRSDPTTWSFRYTSRDETTGDAEYYDGNALVGKSRITFKGKDSFHARITFHRSPSMVGKEYTFRRAP